MFLLERMNRTWFNRPSQRWAWVLVEGLVGGLVGGLIFGQIAVNMFAQVAGPIGWPALGLVGGLIVGLMFAWIGWRADILVKEQTHFRWRVGGLFNGLLDGVLSGLFLVLVVWPMFGLVIALSAGLVAGLYLGLFSALFKGLFSQSSDLEYTYKSSKPNQAISISLRNGLVLGLLFGLLFGLVFMFCSWLVDLYFDRQGGMLRSVSELSPIIALVVGMYFGLDDAIKHYVLRFVLWLDGSMPCAMCVSSTTASITSCSGAWAAATCSSTARFRSTWLTWTSTACWRS
ncbi:MAG: hypothetical protein IPK16_16160 [Anaerolineales bacterium]|nr:hypothetical protein [Anaerolineales bacterium]